MKQRLSNYGFKVERQTDKYALCFCPFHHDTHASAIVYFDSMWFVCFACHKSCSASVAAQEAGFEALDFEASADSFEVNFFEDDVRVQALTPEAKEYLERRGIAGEYPDFLVSPQTNNGVGFAFRDNKGRVIGIQTRLFPENVIDKSSRYVFEGKRMPFFGDMAERYKQGVQMFVFEKAFATLKASIANKRYNLGVAAISSVGSHFNKSLLDFTNIDTVFFFDKDEAGRKAGLRVKELTGARVVLPANPLDELTIEEMTEFLRKYKN